MGTHHEVTKNTKASMQWRSKKALRDLRVFLMMLALCLPVVGRGAATLVDAVKAGDRSAVRALLKNADVNAAEPDGTTPLHWAVRADDADTVRLLLDAGAKTKAANRYGVTPLSLAAVNGSAPVIEMLIKAGREGFLPVAVLAVAGDRDHVRASGQVESANLAGQIVARHAGHGHIGDHQVGRHFR
jgi:hypothetical protein